MGAVWRAPTRRPYHCCCWRYRQNRIDARAQARQRALALVAEYRSVDVASATAIELYIIRNTDVQESFR